MTGDRRATLTAVGVLTLLTICKGLARMAAFPPWKICDEPSHFDNVQYRGELLRAPVDAGKDIPKVMHDGASPELKLSFAASAKYMRSHYLVGTGSVPEEAILAAMAKSPQNRLTDGQASAIGYPGFYYWVAAIPYRMFRTSSILVRLMAVRCLSLLFGVMAAIFTYLAALLALRNDRALAFAAAFVVALQPMESQMTVAVNNDAAVIGLAAIIFFLQLYLLAAPQPSAWYGLALGLSLSCIIFTKPHGYAMIPGTLVVVGWALWRLPRVRERWWLGLMAALPFVALGGVRIYHLYTVGSLVPAPSRLKPDEGFLAFLTSLGDYTSWLFKSAWGQFGWLDFSIDGAWLDLVHAVWFVAVCGLVVASVRWILRNDNRFCLWFSGRLVTFSAATAALVILFILYAEYRFELVGTVHMIQGRSFLFGLPAIVIVTCAGLGSLVPARFRQLSAAALCTAALSLNLASLLMIVRYHVA